MKNKHSVFAPLSVLVMLCLMSGFVHAKPVAPSLPMEKGEAAKSEVSKVEAAVTDAPLLYQSLVAFTKEQHGQLSFPVQPPDFSFAERTNVIPLLVNETSQAVRQYPLVFVPGRKGEPLVLAAMVGIGDGVNRFVGADKQWRSNTYIPAYVRQYPFIAVNTPNGEDTVLAIDTSADWIKTTGPMPFYSTDGKPTERLEQTLAFSREFQLYAKRTAVMVQSLQDAGVLEEGVLNLPPLANADARHISGFVIVSEPKLNALSDDVVLKLHKSGAMGLAYAQLLSMSNLNNLLIPATNALAKPTKASIPVPSSKKLIFAELNK